MIKLYTFSPVFGLPDPSPFVTKVDLYLKLTGIEYEKISGFNNLQKAPKSKLPFIEDNGKLIADSTFIIDHLKKEHQADLDAWLTNEQAAISQLITKSLDENFYWLVVYSRWVRDDVWPIMEKELFAKMPFPLKIIAPKVARSGVKKKIKAHGIGLHSDSEMMKIADDSLSSLSTLLGDKPYFFGDKPCTLDVTAFAMISGLTLVDLKTPMQELALKHLTLVDYTQRICKEYYPEFAIDF